MLHPFDQGCLHDSKLLMLYSLLQYILGVPYDDMCYEHHVFYLDKKDKGRGLLKSEAA